MKIKKEEKFKFTKNNIIYVIYNNTNSNRSIIIIIV
jgi:hypothetical protein